MPKIGVNKNGQLPKPYFQRDGVTLYHGDCRDILPLLPKVDLVLTDPPYGLAGHDMRRAASMMSVEWDDSPADDDLIQMAIDAGIQCVIWGGNYYSLPPHRCQLIWDKINDDRSFAEVESAWTNFDSVSRIFRKWPVNMDGGKVHPYQKPLALMKWCIELADDVETIIDPYVGSGTTLCAAIDLELEAVGIEAEKKYCDIVVKRCNLHFNLRNPLAPAVVTGGEEI